MNPNQPAETGIFRVLASEPRVSIHSIPFTKLQLANAEETLIAFAWGEPAAGQALHPDGTVIQALFRRRRLNGRLIADLLNCAPVTPAPSEALDLLPDDLFPVQNSRSRLKGVLDQLTSTPLKEFAGRILLDFGFAKRFITEPASLNFHHAYPGGLLEHSLECSEIIMDIHAMDGPHRDLGIVAALFHDAGKTLIFENSRRTRTGQLVSHDDLTLFALKNPLSWLMDEWPDAALALMHIWTCKNERRWGYQPLNPLAHLVRLADRWSAEWNKFRSAFDSEPDWKQFARYNGKESFWRPLSGGNHTVDATLEGTVHG